MESQRHYNVDSHSWTLWLGSIPILQDLDQMLYDLVHTPHVKQYWMSKSWIRENNFTLVHWPRLGKALDKMSLSRRLFCSKHTAGMCGIGKFQKIWKTKEAAACPHCGQFEESLHVWKCSLPQVTDVWNNSLTTLQSALC
jgi:hypothetical protein